MFKAATVVSKEPYSRDVGRQMGTALVEKLDFKPGACWLFCTADRLMAELLNGICDAIGTLNIVGCTTDGEISHLGVSTHSAVLAAIASDCLHFQVVFVEGISSDCEQAGRRLALKIDGAPIYVQLFSDGLTNNGCALLRGMASVFGKQIPIAGGSAGDNGEFKKTWQFARRQVLSDAAVAISFHGKMHFGTGVRSGWAPIGLAKKATRASGNILYELNNESALEVYQRFLGKHSHKLPAIGVEYPLSLIGDWGDVGEEDYSLLRATVSVNRQEGSISFGGEIPEGATVSLTCGDRSSVLDAAGKAARLAKSDLGVHEPAMIFCYSCMARKILLGRRTEEEIERVRSIISPTVPVAGFYTYGEYCRVKRGGSSLFHNETIAVTVIGE